VALPALSRGRPRFEILVSEGTDPATNLALERELLREVDAGSRPETVRLWVNDACLVNGPNRSRTSGSYHEEQARRLGIPLHIRSTGGGCVYQDHGNLNWSFYLRRAEGYVGYPKLFRWCSAFVIEALRALGIAALFAEPNRIDVSGRKISGLAARAVHRAALVHGTLLVSTDLERLDSLCIPPPGCPPVIRICDLDPRVSVGTVIDSIKAALA
jgi:lipoate-protein ligase A